MPRIPLHLTTILLISMPTLAAAQVRPATAPVAADPWAPLLRSRTHTPTPTTAAITATDLMTRLFGFADDSMQGRLTDSDGNVKGVEYIAAEAKRIGLQPAGEDGSFFQAVHVPLEKRTFDSTVTIAVDGTPLVPWKDYYPRDPGGRLVPLTGVQVVYGGVWNDDTNAVISRAAARGKFVVLTSSVTMAGNPPGIPSRPVVTARFSDAAGVAMVGLDNFPPQTLGGYRQAGIQTPFDGDTPIYMYITTAAAERLLGAPVGNAVRGAAGKTLSGSLRYSIETAQVPFERPVRNVVALLPGSDPALRGQYVVIGAHNDHIGMIRDSMSDLRAPVPHDSMYVVDHLYRQGGADDGPPALTAAQAREVNAILARVRKATGGKSARADSIFNGADDDGSGSMSVLEIAQYLAAQPIKPKRSILFVWHVGEEEGLYGSSWFADHPTVVRDSIVAELNMDMVGRGAAADQTGNSIDGKKLHGGPGYLQAVGSRRLSTELGDLAESVNRSGKHGIHFDYSMDANGHPQNIYCRSDHAEYAKWGIPIAFFTTGGHADYHQLTDEPQYIDYAKMAQVDNFVADLAIHVANLDHRVLVDKPKPDPKARCEQ